MGADTPPSMEGSSHISPPSISIISSAYAEPIPQGMRAKAIEAATIIATALFRRFHEIIFLSMLSPKFKIESLSLGRIVAKMRKAGNTQTCEWAVSLPVSLNLIRFLSGEIKAIFPILNPPKPVLQPSPPLRSLRQRAPRSRDWCPCNGRTPRIWSHPAWA